MRFLLDTDTCIHALRGTPTVVDAIASHQPGDLALSSITYYELQTGVEKCAVPDRERQKVDLFCRTVSQLVFDMSAALEAARIRAWLEPRGEMIGPYDVLIAGHARALGLTLVTGNTREFSRVQGLKLVSWLATSP